jgi:hypothetical protein
MHVLKSCLAIVIIIIHDQLACELSLLSVPKANSKQSRCNRILMSWPCGTEKQLGQPCQEWLLIVQIVSSRDMILAFVSSCFCPFSQP